MCSDCLMISAKPGARCREKGVMMGGSGSGEWERWDKRDTTDETIGLDVRNLARRGTLRRGFSTVHWSCGDKPAGSIGVRVIEDGPMPGTLTLIYRTRRGEGDWQDVRQNIWLDWTPCTYGGYRPWLVCPSCLKRMAILYSGGAGFYCRKCLRLVYQSQRESSGGRGLATAQAIRRRLGGSANMTEPFPAKPPGMHWRTYDRLHRRARVAEARYDVEFWATIQRWNVLLGRPGAVPQAVDVDALLDELLGDRSTGEHGH